MKTTDRLFSSFLACFLAGVTIHTAVAETSITAAFSSFADGNGSSFHTNGDATVSGDAIRLTQAKNWLSGSAFHMMQKALPVDGSFSAYFTFKMSNPSCVTGGGADGIAFLVRSDPMSSGEQGHGIGYAGTASSVAVEFDTFTNEGHADPEYHHVGINLHGNAKSAAVGKSPFVLNNGSTYHAWIDFDGKKKVLEVRLGDSSARPSAALISHSLDVTAITGTDVYVGFSGATGNCNEQHEIKSLYFNNDLIDGGIDTSLDTYVMKPAN